MSDFLKLFDTVKYQIKRLHGSTIFSLKDLQLKIFESYTSIINSKQCKIKAIISKILALKMRRLCHQALKIDFSLCKIFPKYLIFQTQSKKFFEMKNF